MKNKKLVVEKGYTIEVTSWENDGDHYKTKTKKLDTEIEALAYFKLIGFYSDNFNDQEEYDGDDIAEELIVDFMKEYKEVFISNKVFRDKYDEEDVLVDKFNDIVSSLS